MKNLSKTLLLIGGAALVAGCTPKPAFKLTEMTPLRIALKQAMHDEGIDKSSMRRCFGNGVLNTYNRRIYIVYNNGKQGDEKRYCHIAFSDTPIEGTSRYKIVATRITNVEDTTCELKALSCLKPKAAQSIASQFSLTIDRQPFPKQE